MNGRPPRSQCSRRVGFAQPTRSTGAKRCFAKLLPHPPKGAAPILGAARREVDGPHARIRSLPPRGAAPALGTARRMGGPRFGALFPNQVGMVRVDVMLVTLALLSALGVVAAQHQSRKLHTALERETSHMQQLEVEWGQLQLEQSTWAAHVRIEKIARQRLHMQAPSIEQILVIEGGT